MTYEELARIFDMEVTKPYSKETVDLSIKIRRIAFHIHAQHLLLKEFMLELKKKIKKEDKQRSNKNVSNLKPKKTITKKSAARSTKQKSR